MAATTKQAVLSVLAVLLPVQIFGRVGFQTYNLNDYCGRTLLLDTMLRPGFLLQLADDGTQTDPNLNCGVRIRGPLGYQLLFNFDEVNLGSFSRCQDKYLEIFNGKSDQPPNLAVEGRICGTYYPPKIETGRDAFVRFVNDDRFHRFGDGFKIVVTAYHTGLCRASEHSCPNGFCYDEDLRCRGYTICGDYTDMTNCDDPVGDVHWWIWMIIGIAVFVFILCVVISLVCCLVIKKGSAGRVHRANTTVMYTTGMNNVNPWYGQPGQSQPAPLQVIYQPPPYTAVASTAMHPLPNSAVPPPQPVMPAQSNPPPSVYTDSNVPPGSEKGQSVQYQHM